MIGAGVAINRLVAESGSLERDRTAERRCELSVAGVVDKRPATCAERTFKLRANKLCLAPELIRAIFADCSSRSPTKLRFARADPVGFAAIMGGKPGQRA